MHYFIQYFFIISNNACNFCEHNFFGEGRGEGEQGEWLRLMGCYKNGLCTKERYVNPSSPNPSPPPSPPALPEWLLVFFPKKKIVQQNVKFLGLSRIFRYVTEFRNANQWYPTTSWFADWIQKHVEGLVGTSSPTIPWTAPPKRVFISFSRKCSSVDIMKWFHKKNDFLVSQFIYNPKFIFLIWCWLFVFLIQFSIKSLYFLCNNFYFIENLLFEGKLQYIRANFLIC